MGGYREDLVGNPYPSGEDPQFKRMYMEWVRAGKATGSPVRPLLYMIPSGQYCGDVDANPHGLFHTLSRKSWRNIYYYRQRKREHAPRQGPR